jgi:chromosome segregation ATPase
MLGATIYLDKIKTKENKMQKDLSNATEAIAQGLNNLHSKEQARNLLVLVKRQAEEIERRGQILTELQKTMNIQRENIKLLQQQNAHLEALLETLRNERVNLLEEVQTLSSVTEQTKKKVTRKKKEVETDVADAA